jgi:proteasome accessory factor A
MWRNVEITNPDKWKIEIEDGRTISPIDIQLYYLSKIESIIDTEIEKKTFKKLEKVIDNLKKKNGRELAHNIEWLDRYYAIQELTENTEMASSEAMKICKRYSEIGEERSIFYDRRRKGLIDRTITDDEIFKAIKEPPMDTRAYARKMICDKFEDVVEIDWSRITVSVDGMNKSFNLDDPYSNKPSSYIIEGKEVA